MTPIGDNQVGLMMHAVVPYDTARGHENMMTELADFQWVHLGRVSALLRSGQNGTIVIVPGAMADAQSWLPFAAALRSSKSIAVVNRRGRTPSEDLPRHSTVPDEVEDVREVLTRLEGPFVLVGWSYGGLLSLEAAIGRADVSSIIAYEPVCGPFAPAAVEPIQRAVDAGDLDRAVTLVVTDVSGAPDEQVSALRDGPAWEYLKPLAVPAAIELAALNRHQPDFAGYARIQAPATILIGSLNENKEPYGTAASRFLAALPEATQITLASQGHLAHIEQPGRLAEIVESAITGTS